MARGPKDFDERLLAALRKSTEALLLLEEVVADLGRTNLNLRQRTREDPMTKLLHPVEIQRRIRAEFERVRRFGGSMCLVFFDLDDLKKRNDEVGHQLADESILAFCRTLRAAARAVDQLGRRGGDEFLALLPQTALEDGLAFAERVRAAYGLGVSAGVAVFPSMKRSIASDHDLQSAANAALNIAKRSKNCVRPYTAADGCTPGEG